MEEPGPYRITAVEHGSDRHWKPATYPFFNLIIRSKSVREVDSAAVGRLVVGFRLEYVSIERRAPFAGTATPFYLPFPATVWTPSTRLASRSGTVIRPGSWAC